MLTSESELPAGTGIVYCSLLLVTVLLANPDAMWPAPMVFNKYHTTCNSNPGTAATGIVV